MALFLKMLPIYLLANLHCIGMCGPVALLLGRHRHRLWYFVGRTLAFGWAGALAGGSGMVLALFFSHYQLPFLAQLLFSFFLIGTGCLSLFHTPHATGSGKSRIQRSFAAILLKDHPAACFSAGLLTIFLPCGQSLMLFSACALEGDFYSGLFNGTLFALLTSPALLLAMFGRRFFCRWRKESEVAIGLLAIGVGGCALLRLLR